MRLIGFAGWSGSGKTTLLGRLIPLLTERGLRVSTIKHAHHDFDIDQPGKDSWVHREAGATEVLVASARRFALMHELRDQPEPPLADLLARLAPVDIVFVEGFKRDPHAKIEIHRPELGKPLLCPDDRRIVAVASPLPLSGAPVPWLPLDAPEAIVSFILESSLIAPPGMTISRYPVSAAFALQRRPGRRELVRCGSRMDARGLCGRRFPRGGAAVPFIPFAELGR